LLEYLQGGQLLDFLKKPIFIIILAAALVVAGIWAYISNRNQAKEAEQKAESEKKATEAVKISNLTNIDSSSLNENITSQASVADGKAAEVDKKFQLIAVEVKLPGSLDTGSGETTYVYASSADKINNWVITVSNTTGKFVRARVPKEDYIGGLGAISRDYWKLNYIAALQIAEKNGGLDFRNSNEVVEVRLTLKNSDPKNWLYWFVDYVSKNNMKEIQIDASNGSVVVQ